MNNPTSKPRANIMVCALYKFVTIEDAPRLRDTLMQQLQHFDIKGTLLVAQEGINGTISGSQENIQGFLEELAKDSRFADLDTKVSFHSDPPFHRTKVKLKQEIVTMGVDGIDPNDVVGTYVDANEWNDLISDPDTLLIDTRNEYEYEIGSFTNAVNPHTETFREFPDYVANNLDSAKDKKVAMFCTGGIRCEKASAYMKQQGFSEVYHLKGGILKYLETVEQDQSLWKGECFVFDDRVAVNHALEKGQYDQCHACRYPITEEDKLSAHYIAGVSCSRCHESVSAEQKDRFAEREKQVQLAKQRGESHIGSDAKQAADKNRIAKLAIKKEQQS